MKPITVLHLERIIGRTLGTGSRPRLNPLSLGILPSAADPGAKSASAAGMMTASWSMESIMDTRSETLANLFVGM